MCMLYVCMYVYVCVCVYVCMYVCMCVVRGGGAGIRVTHLQQTCELGVAVWDVALP